jgi:hypothetical protein
VSKDIGDCRPEECPRFLTSLCHAKKQKFLPSSKNFCQAAKISAKQQKFPPSSKNFHQAAKISTKQ